MEFLLLGLAAMAGLALKARQENALAVQAKDTPPSSNAMTQAAAGGGVVAGAAALGGEAAAVGTAALVGFKAGVLADKALLGGDSTTLTKATAGVGGALIAAAAVLLAFSTICPVVFVIVVAVVVITYSVICIVNDAEALAYGQAGARRDFDAHWQKLYDACFHKLRMQTDWADKTDAQIERALTPFVDGYMRHLNDAAFREWMRNPKGITQLGLNSAGKARHGRDRGHFVGDINPDDKAKGELWFYGADVLHSLQDAWVQRVCPASEMQVVTQNDNPYDPRILSGLHKVNTW